MWKGCDGGNANTVFDYIKAYGIEEEKKYPYVDRQNPR